MLDTNIVSQLMRQHPVVTARVLAVPMQDMCISAITEGELLFGLANNPGNAKIHLTVHELLKRVESIAWDSTAAQTYGVVRASMHQQGRGISNLDLLIATHALSMNAILVTNDGAMRQVPGVEIEDWTQQSIQPSH